MSDMLLPSQGQPVLRDKLSLQVQPLGDSLQASSIIPWNPACFADED